MSEITPTSLHNNINQYADTYSGPFIVFAESPSDSINSVILTNQIKAAFGESFLIAVQLNRNQMKIYMNDRLSANELSQNNVCGADIRLFIPRFLTEILGVAYINPKISCDALKRLQSFEKTFVCHNSGPRVLECSRLGDCASSWKVLISFEGQMLPSHVELDHCLFPVSRFYLPLVVCDHCLQFGHDAKQCTNAKRCVKCSRTHKTDDGYELCEKLLCVHCGGNHEANDRNCEVFLGKVRENEIKQSQEYNTNYEEWLCFSKGVASGVPDLDRSSENSGYDSELDDVLSVNKSLRPLEPYLSFDNLTVGKSHEVFISYRRKNGSVLASLLKIKLQQRGYSVFLDVEGLEAGNFHKNLEDSILQAQYFLLILTENALNDCCGDDDVKDWVHREVLFALQSNCKFIPIVTDRFHWPNVHELPADMRRITQFNEVKWVHDYQEACVDKLDKFMRGTVTRSFSSLPNQSRNQSELHMDRSGYSPSPLRMGGNGLLPSNIPRRLSKSSTDLMFHRVNRKTDRHLSIDLLESKFFHKSESKNEQRTSKANPKSKETWMTKMKWLAALKLPFKSTTQATDNKSYSSVKMSDLADTPTMPSNINNQSPTTTELTPEMAQIMLDSFSKKSSLSNSGTSSMRQNLLNTSNSALSTSSERLVNSSSTTTTSRVAKTTSSKHITTSSSSSAEMKAHALKKDLSEMQSSMSEINNLASMGRTTKQMNQLNDIKLSNTSTTMSELQKRIRSSMENLVDDDDTEPLVTFPDSESPSQELQLDLSPTMPTMPSELTNGHGMHSVGNVDTVKYEQKSMSSASKTKVITDGYSSEQATSNSAQMKKLQAGDLEYKEASAAAAMRNRTEMDGVKTEENAAMLKENRSIKAGDFQQQDSNNIAAASIKVQSDSYSAEKKAISQAQQRQTVTSSGMFNQEKHVASSSQSKFSMTSNSSMITSSSQQMSSQSMNGNFLDDDFAHNFEDLERLCPADVEQAINKYSNCLHGYVKNLQRVEYNKKAPCVLDKISNMIQKAWAVPTHGHEVGAGLCNALRQSGGLDLLMKNCVENDLDLQFSSARLLEQCLTTENRSHVVENGLEKVVNGACVCTKNTKTDHSRVGTGILEHLFKHSEGTCSDVIKLGGLDAVLFECRKNDVETLRHCAGALANLSLYGGAENQEAMINRKVPMWLFPLAFHDDDNIKYYACLAIAVLVANKEIEAEVLKSGTLDLVEPFVTTHNPSDFAKSNLAHAHGQSKHWLQRLVPVLSSKREEARNLAAFHFCMEAGIKKQQGNTEIFREIGAIEPLKKVASCPNAVASKFAAQALRLIGEEVPHKLSQQVPLWSTEDVREWVKQIGFGEYEQSFYDARVDGDLLLQLCEEMLRDDLGITNGIRRKRFERELQNLKKMADYSSRDAVNLNNILINIGPEYSIYTYSMLNAGVDKDSLCHLTEDQLISECGITNSIHRHRILNVIKSMESTLSLSSEENLLDKKLDVFVSYRRSNGSQLASLLKVHLQLRGFSVFIDVERLEAGKFDNNLLQSIRQAKHFLLVLTPRALERCVEDAEGKDWVHREIVAAIQSNCNIIPIIDNFQWPEPEELPEDMRSVCHFNGVRWIHDYQDACVDKLERFMRGELNIRTDYHRSPLGRGDMTPSTPSTASVRQHPPVYQRMHSNDSGKGSDKETSGAGRLSE